MFYQNFNVILYLGIKKDVVGPDIYRDSAAHEDTF